MWRYPEYNFDIVLAVIPFYCLNVEIISAWHGMSNSVPLAVNLPETTKSIFNHVQASNLLKPLVQENMLVL